MKILIGDGASVEVRDVSDVIYRIDAKDGFMLPLHGYVILCDDDARDELEHLKMFGVGKNLVN